MARAGSRRYGSERPQNWPAVGHVNRNSPGDTVNGILQERLLNPKYFTHFERFLKLPQLNATIDQVYTTEAARIVNQHLELTGTGVGDDDISFRPGGGVNCETEADDDDQVIIAAHLDAGPVTALAGINWSSSRRPLFYANIITGPAADDLVEQRLWAGFKLTNVSVTATDADQFFFRLEDGVNSGIWQTVTSVNDTDDENNSDTGVAAENQNFRLMVEVDRDRVPHYWINDVYIDAGPALRDLATFEFYLGIESSGASDADKAWGIRNFIVSQLIS